jgi:hypothetical protein
MVHRRYIRTNWAEAPLPAPDQMTLPITREEVVAAERLWGRQDRPAWESQWLAIGTIASDIWSTPVDDLDRLRRLWMLLTCAVGNFKRQGNTVIFPLPSPWRLAPLPGQSEPRDMLSIPVDDMALTLNSHGTTEPLEGLTRGLASVPTGSTLLTALWPTEHAIMDIRDFQVVVGLLAHQGIEVVPRGETASLSSPDWKEYRWFRLLMKTEAARLRLDSPLILERALFVAYGYRPKQAVSMAWSQWGTDLLTRWHKKASNPAEKGL